jgi:hypothetical protein
MLAEDLRNPSRPETGTEMLALATIEAAVKDALRVSTIPWENYSDRKKTRASLQEQAMDYISSKATDIYSFENLCCHLDIDAGWLRRKVCETIEARNHQMMKPSTRSLKSLSPPSRIKKSSSWRNPSPEQLLQRSRVGSMKYVEKSWFTSRLRRVEQRRVADTILKDVCADSKQRSYQSGSKTIAGKGSR